MRRTPLLAFVLTAAVAGTAVPAAAGAAPPDRWARSVGFTERVVSSPVAGGGYPGESPAPGGCVAGRYDANFAESTLAAQPGTERLVGGAKAYFDRWSTFRAQHTAAFAFDGFRPSTHLVNGFDCVTTGTQAMPPSWSNVTDPNMAFDRMGRVHQLALPFNAFWGTIEQPNGDIVGTYSDDGGRTWQIGNGGAPVQPGPELSTQSSHFLDKPFVAVNQVPGHRWVNHVYGVWVEFDGDAARIRTSASRDRGVRWDPPSVIPTGGVALGPANPWPFITVGADGAVYVTFTSYGEGDAATIWVVRSTDDGRTWSAPSRVVDTTVNRDCCVPGSKVHDGVVEWAAASPDQPGHVHVVWEELVGGRLDVRLATSRDGGRTWSAPQAIGDAWARGNRFQPQVATGSGGAVAVAFYDQRADCPRAPFVTPANRGKSDTCIAVSLQAYRDTGRRLVRVRSNLRLSTHPWDPDQPSGTRGGIGQHACEDVADPCDDQFIGDYFQLVVTPKLVHVLSASTRHPSGVRGDHGRPLYYLQQVLASVRRDDVGLAG